LVEGADRPALLQRQLKQAGVRSQLLELAGGRFLLAWPKQNRRDEACRQKIFTAHHDRVAGTPGALDNSAAILQLFNYLVSGRPAVNTLVIFTDREELSGTAVEEQGSWVLGQAFAGMGYKKPLVFSLDVCGRGDTLLLSSAAETLRARVVELNPTEEDLHQHSASAVQQVAEEVKQLSDGLQRLLGSSLPVRRARVPFGEDLGFLCAGQTALVLTVLPRAEYESLTGFSFDADTAAPLPPWASLRVPGIPDTWRYLHSAEDRPNLYTADAFALIAKTLDALGRWRLPVYLN